MLSDLRIRRLYRSPWEFFRSGLVSLFVTMIVHFALFMIPHTWPGVSPVQLIPVSGIVMVFTLFAAGWCRRLLGILALAPAFVLFNILFIWGFYLTVVREGISTLPDAFVNMMCALLLFGLYRIFSGDPGIISYSPSPVDSDQHDLEGLELQHRIQDNTTETSLSRLRQCNHCRAYIKAFDHHCPAFGNCIGQKNHRLFLILLFAFIVAEASYSFCANKLIEDSKYKRSIEGSHTLNFMISTSIFCTLQVLWQMVFFTWHLYCISFNIKTEEWINWRKYPEFQLVAEPLPGSTVPEIKFTNPYDKGLPRNIMKFLTSEY